MPCTSETSIHDVSGSPHPSYKFIIIGFETSKPTFHPPAPSPRVNCHLIQASWNKRTRDQYTRRSVFSSSPAGVGMEARTVIHCCPENKACLTLRGEPPGSISKASLQLDNLSIHLSKCPRFLFQGRWSNNKFAKKVNLCPKHFSKLKGLREGWLDVGYVHSCQLLFDLLSP